MKDEVGNAIQCVPDHGQYIMGPEVEEMEQALCDLSDVGHCVAVASGTEALLISLMALGIGPRDEVTIGRPIWGGAAPERRRAPKRWRSAMSLPMQPDLSEQQRYLIADLLVHAVHQA